MIWMLKSTDVRWICETSQGPAFDLLEDLDVKETLEVRPSF